MIRTKITDNDIQKLTDSIGVRQVKSTKKNTRLTELEAELYSKTVETDKLKQDNEKLQEDIKKKESEIRQLQVDLNNQIATVMNLNQQIANINTDVINLNGKVTNLNETNFKLSQELLEAPKAPKTKGVNKEVSNDNIDTSETSKKRWWRK